MFRCVCPTHQVFLLLHLPQASSSLRWYCLEAYDHAGSNSFLVRRVSILVTAVERHTDILTLRALARETRITSCIKRRNKALLKALHRMSRDLVVEKGEVHCSINQ